MRKALTSGGVVLAFGGTALSIPFAGDDVLIVGASLIPGQATAEINAFAPGALLLVQATLISGDAYGPLVAGTGFIAARGSPKFSVTIGTPNRTAAIDDRDWTARRAA